MDRECLQNGKVFSFLRCLEEDLEISPDNSITKNTQEHSIRLWGRDFYEELVDPAFSLVLMEISSSESNCFNVP